MSALALTAKFMPRPDAIFSAGVAQPNKSVAVFLGGIVHSPVGGRVANFPALSKFCGAVAIAAGINQKLQLYAGQSVPTVAAVVNFGTGLLFTALAYAARPFTNLGANETPARTGKVVGVRGKAHACQEKVTLLIRGELFAHCGDSQKRTDCAAALVASVVTTITVGIRAYGVIIGGMS